MVVDGTERRKNTKEVRTVTKILRSEMVTTTMEVMRSEMMMVTIVVLLAAYCERKGE